MTAALLRRFVKAKLLIEAQGPELWYFDDDAIEIDGCRSNLRKYAKVLSKAVNALRPAAECLKSGPLLRILRNASAALEGCVPLLDQLTGISDMLSSLDRVAVAEEKRIVAALSTGRKVDAGDVIIPDDYTTYVDRDDIGTAGSPADSAVERCHQVQFNVERAALKAYERLVEMLPSWEGDLQVSGPLHDVVSLAESILDSARAEAARNSRRD